MGLSLSAENHSYSRPFRQGNKGLAVPNAPKHIIRMNATALALPVSLDFIGHAQKAFLRRIADDVEEICLLTTALSRFEDEKLLDNPTPENLAMHKATLKEILVYGKLLVYLTGQPEFPDKDVAATLAANQKALEYKLILWHNTMTEAEREQILKEVFNEC